MEQKVFGIGYNKTGLTSLRYALKELKYKVGDRASVFRFINSWAKRDFNPIIEFCKTSDAFIDIPFSRSYTFQILDHVFTNSKFILTIRDYEEWFDSFVRYNIKRYSSTDNPPTEQDFKNNNLVYKGFLWDLMKVSFGDVPLFDKKAYVKIYNKHNEDIIDYFKFRKDLLILKVSDKQAYPMLCKFLDKPIINKDFPWKNKS